MKAVGKGLREPLDSFTFNLNSLEISFLNKNVINSSHSWNFGLFWPSNDHLCALSVAHSIGYKQKIKFQQIHWLDLDTKYGVSYTTKLNKI